VKGLGEPINLGVVQTAYANGSSTNYITHVLVRCYVFLWLYDL